MKLPKPGNVKLPKPGKVKLPKPGKMPGNLKLPAFHMKNGFLKKNLITLIAAAVLIIGTGTAYGTLATREADRGFDPIEGVNQDRYQVLVSGEGYKLSKIQERNYKLQKKQNEVNAAQAAQTAQNNPTTIRTSSGSRVYRTSNYRYRPRTSSSYNTTGTVFISTNIYSQKSSKPNWKSGDEFSFMVTAYTYKNGKKTTLSKDNIKVKSDKGTLKHTGSKDGNQQYVLKLDEGLHKITVTAKDKNSKRESKNTYIITVGKGTASNTKPTKKPTKPDNTDSTDPTTEEKPETVDVGFGLTSSEMVITEKTQAYDVLSHTEGITTRNGEVVEVTGKFSGISITELEGYDEDDFKKIYKEEESGVEKDKKNLEEEISEKLRKEFSDKPIEEMSEEEINNLNKYIEENFDDYFMEHYFDDYFDKWIKRIEKEIQDKTTIETGEPFHGDYKFKWKYDKVTGKDVLKKINLRLTLDK